MRAEWLTLGEVSRRTKISRDALRAACDVGRLPCKRSESSYRLIAADVVEQLRQRGWKAFPHPASSASGTIPEQGESPKRTTAVEKIGLLGQPSPELQRLKEDTEGQKMQLERARTAWELERVERERAEECRQIAEEEQRAQEQQEAEENRTRLEQARAADAERRTQWLEKQAHLAVEELGRARWENLDLGTDDHHLTRALRDALTEALSGLGPDTGWYELARARERAVNRVLEPYRREKQQREIVESALRGIGRYLRELRDKGWIAPTFTDGDVDLLARQLEGPMRSALEAAAPLTQERAKEVLFDAIDRRLRII